VPDKKFKLIAMNRLWLLEERVYISKTEVFYSIQTAPAEAGLTVLLCQKSKSGNFFQSEKL